MMLFVATMLVRMIAPEYFLGDQKNLKLNDCVSSEYHTFLKFEKLFCKIKSFVFHIHSFLGSPHNRRSGWFGPFLVMQILANKSLMLVKPANFCQFKYKVL